MRKTGMMMLTALLAVSCQYKDLCYDHHHTGMVTLAYDWTDVQEASPAGMTALFYGGAAAPVRYDFSGMQGGNANIPTGSWQAVSYNNDTESVLYRGDGVESLEAYTRKSSLEEGSKIQTQNAMPMAKGTEGEAVILEPDLLWGGASQPFTVEDAGRQTITIFPQELAAEVEVTICNVPNLQYISGIGGAMSGLAGSVFVASGTVGAECVTQSFEVSVADATTLKMHFRTFGHCPQADAGVVNTHVLTIYAVLADGTQWYYTEDVTTQMHEASRYADPHHLILELDGLPVPKPIVNGSGLQPTVDGWQEVDIEVTM